MKFCSFDRSYMFQFEQRSYCYQPYRMHMTVAVRTDDELFTERAPLNKSALDSLELTMQ